MESLPVTVNDSIISTEVPSVELTDAHIGVIKRLLELIEDSERIGEEGEAGVIISKNEAEKEWLNLGGEELVDASATTLAEHNLGAIGDFGRDVAADVLKDITEAIEAEGLSKGCAINVIRKSAYKIVKVHLAKLISKLACTSKPKTVDE